MVTGHPKKSVSWADHLFFVGLYCCFIQTWHINNDWNCDFWHLRCLFYQVELILFHFQQLEFFVFQKFPWNTAKMVKKFAMSKNTSNILFKTCWTLRWENHLHMPKYYPVRPEILFICFLLIFIVVLFRNGA